ncbi:serine/threonine-protein kinase, partial [Pseudonocardia sp.]|uniref:protein kinase domain-containing protein n=1 Tax=Pseudonocardia sp. TaxID=60912 RepID=UPI002607D14C
SEFIDGPSLEQILAQNPLPMDPKQAMGIIAAAAMALEAIHRQGVVHLDLKPANILVSRYGEPKLGDFGISRLPGVTETSGGVRASPAYAAPERLAEGATTVQTDLYGLGATLFALVAGAPAFVGSGPEDLLVMLTRIVGQPVPDLRPHGVPDTVCRVLERLMAKTPAGRFARAGDAALALQDAQRATGQPVTRAVIEGAPTVTEEAAAPTSLAIDAAPATAPHPPGPDGPVPSWPATARLPGPAPSRSWPGPEATVVPPRQAPRRPTRLVVGIAAALAVAALTVGGVLAATLPRTGGGSVPPPAAASATGTPTTTVAPDRAVVSVAAGVAHPETENVLSTVQAYVDTVNDERYAETFALFSPDSRTAGNGLAAWLDLQRPREVDEPVVAAVREGDGGSLDVVWTFVSTQAPEDGPGGDQACTEWEIAWDMAGPGPEWLIRTSDVLASRAC